MPTWAISAGFHPTRMVRDRVAALILNYGQGGLLLADPNAAENPFYLLVPRWAHYPMIAFATVATVIASQAIISGAYSLTQQAMQLGFLPRMRVLHTASHEKGQIYIPVVNWLLALGTLAAMLIFGSSDALGGAYGIAVSMLMAVTTVLAALVALKWGYNPILVVIGERVLLCHRAGFRCREHDEADRGRLVPAPAR